MKLSEAIEEAHGTRLEWSTSTTYEWWHGKRKLTVDVNDDGTIDLLRVWGPDMYSEMEDFRLEGDEDFAPHWEWLHET